MNNRHKPSHKKNSTPIQQFTLFLGLCIGKDQDIMLESIFFFHTNHLWAMNKRHKPSHTKNSTPIQQLTLFLGLCIGKDLDIMLESIFFLHPNHLWAMNKRHKILHIHSIDKKIQHQSSNSLFLCLCMGKCKTSFQLGPKRFSRHTLKSAIS